MYESPKSTKLSDEVYSDTTGIFGEVAVAKVDTVFFYKAEYDSLCDAHNELLLEHEEVMAVLNDTKRFLMEHEIIYRKAISAVPGLVQVYAEKYKYCQLR